MKNHFLLWILLVCSSVFAQEVVMTNNGRVDTCTGIFTDSGGAANPFQNNENLTFTICPDAPGKFVKLNFTSFEMGATGGDELTIYNAENALDPGTVFGVFDTTPNVVVSANPSGCLTFVFESSPAVAAAGWTADISCVEPCQTITSFINTSNPLPNADGIIRVCVDEDITLTGAGTFSAGNAAGATYQWDLGDGNTIDGQDAVFSYPNPGVYIVNLNITDTNTSVNPDGCSNTNLINQVIQVSTVPDFNRTTATDPTICFGDSTTIEGVVKSVFFNDECTPPVADVTYLEDIAGALYKSSIKVDCFASNQILENINQLTEICLNIEHSYLGDLEIAIISPDGQRVTLHEYPGGSSTFLGAPNGDDSENPGVGARYCFSMSGTKKLVNGNTITAGNPAGDSIEPGVYLPEESFAGLVGEPLNGQWTIEITDFLPVDNGYIFGWDLNFDPAILPADYSFEPTIVNEAWDPDPSIINTTGSTITVQPTTSGEFCYTYRVEDDFNCVYTEEVCIDVLPELIYDAPINIFICDPGAPPLIFDLTENEALVLAPTPNPADISYTLHTSQSDADNDVGAISDTDAVAYEGLVGDTIFIRFEYLNSGCYETLPFNLGVSTKPEINSNNPLPPLPECEGDVVGTAEFNLTAMDPTVKGTQLNVEVSYHLTETEAEAGTSPLTSPYASPTQQIFCRLKNTISGCYVVAPLDLVVLSSPTVPSIDPYPLCDEVTLADEQEIFDLTTKTADIIGTANVSVSYHLTVDNARDDVLPLPDNYTNITNPQTIFVRIQDQTNFCVSVGSFDLVVNPLPNIPNPSPFDVCDDLIPDSITNFDLSQKEDELSGGDPNYSVTYYFDLADALAENSPLPTIYQNITDPQIIVARIENTTTQCFTTVDLELNVVAAPIVFDPPPLPYCDPDSDGFGEFMLIERDDFITGGVTGIDVNYYETLPDAENGVNPLSSPYSNIVQDSQTVWARAEYNTVSNDCPSIVPLVLEVFPTPQIQDPEPLQRCDDDVDQIFNFNLRDAENDFLNGISPLDVEITYYESDLDAENSTNPIITPGFYPNTSNPQTVWIRVSYPVSGCHKLTSLELIVNPLPSLVLPQPLELCDDLIADGQTIFDLTERRAQIIAGDGALDLTYHETFADAQNGTAAIVDPANYTNRAVGVNPPNPQTIFVRGTRPTTGCFDITTLNLRVLPNPTPSLDPEDLKACDYVTDGDGQEVFDLTENETYILNGETNVTPTYHESFADAESGSNPLTGLNTYTNTTPWLQPIFVRVTDDFTQCYTIVDFDVIVSPVPTAEPVDDIIACEISTDDIFSFDLEIQTLQILGGQNPTEFEVTYHTTLTDAKNGIDALISPYTNIADPQTIYIAVTNIASGCRNTSQNFKLEVQEGALANGALDVFAECDDNVEIDGDFSNDSIQFDLSTQNDLVLLGQDPVNYKVSYYANQFDADLGINPLPLLYENVINPQQIIARVDNDTMIMDASGAMVDSSVCYTTVPLVLEVLSLPVIDLELDYILCVDTNGTEVLPPLEIDTGLSIFDYRFLWTDMLTGTVVGTGSSYVPIQEGFYALEVVNVLTNCEASIHQFTVTESSPPVVTANVGTEAFSQVQLITAQATGIGIYEFNLDQGPWGSDGNFVDVPTGSHIVTARDLNGCGISAVRVNVIGYPQYFTPNGDGYHDTWNISSLGAQGDSKIFIFDRYGKLIKQIYPSGDGWDGTYNGQEMPSSDYWFTVQYTEPSTNETKEYKSHFTLKR
jgi:gliding motility-associated-like protein